MMTTAEVDKLVSETERKAIAFAAECAQDVIRRNLEESGEGYYLEDLAVEIGAKLGNYLPMLNIYIKLIQAESRLYNPVTAYAYGKRARDEQVALETGLNQYQLEIGRSKEANLCANLGRIAFFLRQMYGEAPDSTIHPVDQLAGLYRQIYGAVGMSEEVFFRHGYENRYCPLKKEDAR